MAKTTDTQLTSEISEYLETSSGITEPKPTDFDCPLAYLLSLTDEQLEQIIKDNPPTKSAEERDAEFNEAVEGLVELTSEQEVDAYMEFVEKYAEMGGHSLDYVETKTASFSPVIQDLAIQTAAEFDRFTGSTFAILDDGSEITDYCKGMMFAEFGLLMITEAFLGTLTGGAVPAVDAGATLIEVAGTLTSYHACKKTGHWY